MLGITKQLSAERRQRGTKLAALRACPFQFNFNTPLIARSKSAPPGNANLRIGAFAVAFAFAVDSSLGVIPNPLQR